MVKKKITRALFPDGKWVHKVKIDTDICPVARRSQEKLPRKLETFQSYGGCQGSVAEQILRGKNPNPWLGIRYDTP